MTGSTGFLGGYLLDEIRHRGLVAVGAGREDCEIRLDLGETDEIGPVIAAVKPRYTINCAAMSSLGACRANPTLAIQVNGKGPPAVARACGGRFLQVSTDLVFGGDEAPYGATAPPRPLSIYGSSKVEGEKIETSGALVVRVPLLFGRSRDGRRGATDMLRRGLDGRERLTLFSDEYRTPLHAADAARGILDLLLDESSAGVRHLGGHESVSRWELATRFCGVVGIEGSAFVEGESEDPGRPKNVSLTGDWVPGRDLDTALADC